MPNEKKIFVGSGKTTKNPKYINANISEKGLQILKDNIQEYLQHKYAPITITILDEPNQHGKNVEITLNTYRKSAVPEVQTEAPETDQREMPF